MKERYPKYCLDELRRIQNVSDLTIDLDELLDLLKSNNIAKYQFEKEKFWGPHGRFVGKSSTASSFILCTYPRSGNSMMRKHFQNLTGVATGSDLVTKHGANIILQ